MKRRIKALMLMMFAGGLAVSACANHSPVFLPIYNQSVESGQLLDFLIEAVDDDGDRLTFSASDKPETARLEAVNANTARFTWTPLASDAGADGQGRNHSVSFAVTDGSSTATETISIFVSLGGVGSGAPVFISPSDYTLDLDLKSSIEFAIEVRDADSAEVELRVVENIPGGIFDSVLGQKHARFEWAPSIAQVSERPVWNLRVGANDRINPEVFLDITILLKGGQKKCEGTPPLLTHTALADQFGGEDYPISVKVEDLESEITSVALYWLKDDGTGDAFTKIALTAAGGDDWLGHIANADLPPDQSVDYTYYLCATDNDDAAESTCDLRSCLPADGRYVFTAYADVGTPCDDDSLEGVSGNDSFAQASPVEFDVQGDWLGDDLNICPGNQDWFQLPVPKAGLRLDALLEHTQANGQLEMKLFGQDGSSLLVAGTAEGDLIDFGSLVFDQPQTVYLLVAGQDAEVRNRYTVLLTLVPDIACAPDLFEAGAGNDSPAQAVAVAEDLYVDLSSCSDPDWYRISLDQGQQLEAELEFAHDDGDLDLWIFDAETALGGASLDCAHALSCSNTYTDNEWAWMAAAAAGDFYLAVVPKGSSHNSYQMLLTVMAQTCQDDADEANDEPGQAVAADVDVPRLGRVLCPGNEDWYQTLMYPGEKMLIDLSFVHAEGDLELKLYRPEVNLEQMAQFQMASSVSSDNNEHIEYDITEEGYYFIRVFGYEVQARTTYDLLVSY